MREAFVPRSLHTKFTSPRRPVPAHFDRPGDLPARSRHSVCSCAAQVGTVDPGPVAGEHASRPSRLTCSCCCADFPAALGSLAVVMVSVRAHAARAQVRCDGEAGASRVRSAGRGGLSPYFRNHTLFWGAALTVGTPAHPA